MVNAAVGSTTCAQGVCTYGNDYYSQCLPGTATTTATPPPISTTSTASQPATTTSSSTGSTASNLPSVFKWSSSAALIGPHTDSHDLAALKDPSIMFINGTYHVFASTAIASGYNLVYFSAANASTYHYLDATPIGTGYRAAPQVFFFSPQNLWYLVYQTGNAAYSTNTDIANPAGWTAPKTFYTAEPAIVTANIGASFWVDMWVICDAANCHLFSEDDNGHLYRSDTTLANFPNGMSQPVIALSDPEPDNLFEASKVYHVGNLYLLIVEYIGTNGRRYFRSWTSTSLTGTWSPYAATMANPFTGSANVAFTGTPWTGDISHGEMICTNDTADPVLFASRAASRCLRLASRVFLLPLTFTMAAEDDLNYDETTDDGLDDTNVDGMIGGLPEAQPNLNKWMVMSPELMKQKEKSRKVKEKRQEKKRKRLLTTDNDDDDLPTRNNKKGKQRRNEDDEAVVLEITAFIHVMKPPPAALPRTRTKPKAESLYIQRGPFKFLPDISYDAFLTLLATTLPCPIANLALNKVVWKPQTPANRGVLPLGGSFGYGVLLDTIRDRAKDRIIIISMPAPRTPAEDAPFWATKEDEEIPHAAPHAGPSNAPDRTADVFDFAELKANSTEDSIEQQRITFDKAVGPKTEDLKDRWPINDEGKRIYTDDRRFLWELNAVRLSVWAAHLVRGTATLDTAPVSGQFDIRNRIKTVAKTNTPPPPPIAASTSAAPAPVSHSSNNNISNSTHRFISSRPPSL
ncbi:glycosyl hydrolase family 62-domain-containing protein [Mycena rosella]|uniref:Alpha-L-arabinofuranosidase n=1 Tax=Mycena rosella TaxID=1033263 RepID=A0AAD7GRY1_MYCRO|nr:glycosyl hydrolase family 62-domain-containing protein [Mycena rosella]